MINDRTELSLNIDTASDDVITYLAPTLEQHKGCTIIDVHPGACLWSSKIHEYLQPRRHLLMEPEQRYFEPFIRPLLEKSGSTYRHTLLTGAHATSYWDNYRKVLADSSLVPPAPELASDDPKLRQADPSLLVIGNLWRDDGRYRAAKYVSVAPLILQHMTYAGLCNEIFQRNGLVRMLWWAPDVHKADVFAESTYDRSAFNVGLDIGADVTEVAGTTPSASIHRPRQRQRRTPSIESGLTDRIDQNMRGTGMKVPTRRPLLRQPQGSSELAKLNGPNPMESTCPTIPQLEESIDEFKAVFDRVSQTFLTRLKKSHNSGDPAVLERAVERLKYPQSIALIRSFNKYEKSMDGPMKTAQAVTALDLSLQIVHMEANYAVLAEDGTSGGPLQHVREQVLELGANLDNLIRDRMFANAKALVDMQLEDLIAFYASPAVVSRYRRPYDPLQVHAHEFWPKHDMTLLDVVPLSRDLAVPDIADRKEGARTCQELLQQLFLYPALPLPAVLDRIAPNAAQDLIPQVGIIADARRGGRLDPNKVKVRMLSTDMIEGLNSAFLEWPFRPSTLELALASGDVDTSGATTTAQSV